MQELIEDEALKHFTFVRAANAGHEGVPIDTTIKNMETLRNVRKRLGYHLDSSDGWAFLGIAPLEGAEPTEAMIESRGRTLRLLLTACEDNWNEQDKKQVTAMRERDEAARDHCHASLKEWLKERKKTKMSKAPRWAELGMTALQYVIHTAQGTHEAVATQLSDVLEPEPGLRRNFGDRVMNVTEARTIAEKAEKGDATM